MNFQRHVWFWVSTLTVLVLLLWLLSPILLPFVAGMALAYLLHPLAKRLERLGVNRMIATILVIGVFVMAFVVLLLVMAPVLGNQLSAFIGNIPDYIRKLQAVVADPSRPWLAKFFGEGAGSSDKSVSDLVTQGASWLTAALGGLWSGSRSLISVFSLIAVMPVVAFYLIYDWERMLATVDRWVPVPHRQTVRELAREIDGAIAGFLRGQTAVCLLLGSFYAVALSLVGLNFGLLIGMVSGIIGFIPYIGSMTGLILAVGVATAQFWPDWSWILTVAGIFVIGQFFEGNILQPKLVGESVGLHPVWVMFALFAFGYLFGFVGLLLAVPLAAAVGVLLRFALRQYLESPLYRGEVTD